MKKLMFLMPISLLANVPQAYDSATDLAKLKTISDNIAIIKTAFNKAISKLQDCDKVNKANMTEIGKTSSAITSTGSAFDDILTLANQTSSLVDDMTKRSVEE